jgi:hypothetical protein
MHIFVAVEFMVSASAIAVILERADAIIARASSPTRLRGVRRACVRTRVCASVCGTAPPTCLRGACVRAYGRAGVRAGNAACPGIPSGADLSAASSPPAAHSHTGKQRARA